MPLYYIESMTPYLRWKNKLIAVNTCTRLDSESWHVHKMSLSAYQQYLLLAYDWHTLIFSMGKKKFISRFIYMFILLSVTNLQVILQVRFQRWPQVSSKKIRAATKQQLPSTFHGHSDQRAYVRHLVPGWAQLKQQWFAGSRLHKGISFSSIDGLCLRVEERRRWQHVCVYAQIFVFVWWVLASRHRCPRCRQMDSRSGRFILGTRVVAHSGIIII